MKFYITKNIVSTFLLILSFQTYVVANEIKVVLAVPKRSGINMTTQISIVAVGCLLLRPILKTILPEMFSKSVLTQSSFGKLKTLDCLTGVAAGLLVAIAEYVYHRYYPVTESDWDLMLLENPEDLPLQAPAIVTAEQIIAPVAKTVATVERVAYTVMPETLEGPQLSQTVLQEPIELDNISLDVTSNTVSLVGNFIN